MMFLRHALIIFFSVWCTFVYADKAPQGLTLQGTVLTPAGLPLEDASVDFAVQVRSPGAEDCLLYEETHTLNMTGSGGAFSLIIGSGARSGVSFEDTSDLSAIFSNATGTNFTGLTCSSGTTYSPLTTHSRNVLITFDDGSGPQTLNQVLPVQAVPYALHADTLRGKAPSAFLQANTTAPADVTQANIENIFSTTNLPRLQSMLAVPPANYVQTGANGSASAPGVAGNPLTPAAGQFWYDTTNNVLKYYDGTSVQALGSAATPAGTTGQIQFNNAGALGASTNLNWDSGSNSLGIGTASPLGTLDVRGSIYVDQQVWDTGGITVFSRISSTSANANPLLRLTNYNQTLDTKAGIVFAHQNASTFATNSAAIQASMSDITNGAENGYMAFVTRKTGTMTEQMRIDHNGNVGIGTTAPAATLDVAGSIRVGTAAMTCDATKEGVFRWNTTLKKAEVCDGVAWRWLAANNSGAALTVQPNVQNNMNITVGGGPGYSNTQTFVVTNVGDSTSATLSVSLSNTAYFELVADACNGITLAPNATCNIQVRSKSYADTSFSGTLNIIANNNPTVQMSGTATGSCGALGGNLGGGVLAACYSTYALIAMPGGCADSTSNPTCLSGTDIVQKVWTNESVSLGSTSSSDGIGNTTLIMTRVATSGAGTYPAAEHCADMVYGGYSDWYLPSIDELNVLYGVKNAIGGVVGNYYWSSTEKTNVDATWENLASGFIPSGTWGETRKFNSYYVRCVRRH